ncbi:Increased DNA methylation 1 [Spatholobus suberectus]|nr:Increased DNA methylation 1 [Spatholobus suberectus]
MESTATVSPDSENDATKTQHQRVNGYVVYARRKRTLHSDNDTAKRLKTAHNAEIKVEAREAALDDAVFGAFKVESEDGAVANAEELTKVELKTSKKIIVVNKKPVTVKELFETGLLDGVPVVYVGCKKDSTSGLRGVIKDGGILCSCRLCNGRRVIPPSQFEIHACNIYKRAAQYICLENGKSLLELLRACRAAPLHTLEATIQNFVSSPPEEKYFTCKSCRGCFPSSNVERVGLLCLSCVESRKSEDSSIHAVGKRVRSPRPVLFSRSCSCCTSELCISPQSKRHWKTRTKSSKLSVKLKTAPITSKCLSPQNKSQWRISKRHQRLHKLIFEEDGLPNGAEVAYYARGQKLLEGIKTRSGIVCRCCNTEISPSQFEVHAGWASRRKPYASIYTSNGVSLHELGIFLSKDHKCTTKQNDYVCVVCWDGGNLLLCDGCPRAFHKECASVSSIPRGEWYCQICQHMFLRERPVLYNADAVAAGRVEGVDPIEQIAKRCIRIVKDIGAEIGGCVLCRSSDFSRSGFGPRTIIICDQCEKEYHVGCLRDHKMAYLKELPEGDWLCCNDCTRIHSTLENLLVRVAERLPESLLDVIKKKQVERCLEPLNEIDVRWKLLNGKIASPETRPLLLEAVSMFHECFDPIVDPAAGRDLIPAMVYGRNLQTQDFGGMYCALLIVNSSVVSAGMLRIFGEDIAELPLVATRYKNRGKGYFQTLFSCIERLLAFLNVKNLVLPAAEEAESIWTEKFGFSKMKPDQLTNYRMNCHQIMAFKGTIMLHKTVPRCRVINTQSCEVCIQESQS